MIKLDVCKYCDRCPHVEHFVGNRNAVQKTGVRRYAVEGQCRRVM